MVIIRKQRSLFLLSQTHTRAHTLFQSETDLGNEHQTERDGAAKDDHQCHDAELDIGLVSGQKGHRGTDDAHDAHVVHAHPDVLAVIEGRDAHVPGLPCQETAKQLSGKREIVFSSSIRI